MHRMAAPVRVLRRLAGRVAGGFARERRGAVALEIAFAVPVVFGLIVSGVEITRYVLLHQKLERTAATIADLTSQAELLSEADLSSLFVAAGNVMTPYDLGSDGRVVMSSIYREVGNNAEIVWQRGYGGGSGASRFGLEGELPALPADLLVRDGENVIVAEVFFDFEPMLAASVLETDGLYNYAVFRPRFGSLRQLLP